MLLRSLVGNYARQAATTGLRELAERKIEHDRNQIIERQSEKVSAALVFANSTESGGLCDLMADELSVKGSSYLERSGHVHGRTIVIAETGIGAEASQTATRSLLQTHEVPFVIAAGFAASLDDRLAPGHILMVEQAVNEAGESIAFHQTVDRKSIEQHRKWHLGDLISVTKEVRTPAARASLAESSSAIACDMETFAIAKVCQELKIPCVAVRVISDGLNDEDQQIVDRISEQNSLASKLGATAGALWKKPKIATRMLGLKQTAIERSDELAAFLDGLLRQLPE